MLTLKNNHIFAIIVAVYAALFFIYPHTEYNPADAGFKVLQVKDFIKQNYSTFKAVYNGNSIDPEKAFFPGRPMNTHKVRNDIYYTFPFTITLLFTPAYLVLGIYGIILLSTIFGILTIFISLKTARLMNISEERIRWMLIFLGCASIIPIYSYMVGEYTLTLFLITLSIYLILLAKESGNKALLYFLAGLSAGLSVFFRIELGFFCFLLFLGVIVFKVYDAPKTQIPALFLSLAICGITLMVINYLVYYNVLGLRGIEFMTNAGSAYSITDRLLKLFATFFLSDQGIGLFVAWPVFAFLFALFFRANRDLIETDYFKYLLCILILFCISIPILVSNRDGSVIGPRFLAPLQPLIIIMTFKILDSDYMKTRKKVILSRVLIIYSAAIIIFGMYVLYRFDQISQDVNIKIARYVKNRVVILHNLHLRNSVLSLFEDRIIFYINPKKDWNTILQKTKALGVRDFTVLDFAGDKKAIWYPFDAADVEVMDRNFYHGNFKNTIIENIHIKR